MNRKWKVILSLLISSLIFPIGVLGVPRYFTFYLPLEFGITTNISKTTTESLDIEKSSTDEDSISSEPTETDTKTTNSFVETISSSLELTIMDEKESEEKQKTGSKEQTHVDLQQEGEQ